MQSLSTPLDQTEMEELDNFLRDRLSDEELADDQDEGIINISELDGFFTALVSGPEMIAPSEWLPAIWGDYPPQWASEEDAQRPFGLLVRHMNAIATTLEEEVEFEPLFLEGETEDEVEVADWCLGYMKGVSMRGDVWDEAGDDLWELMVPVVVFSGGPASEALDDLGEEEILSLQAAIPDAAQSIHAWWRARRTVQ